MTEILIPRLENDDNRNLKELLEMLDNIYKKTEFERYVELSKDIELCINEDAENYKNISE